MQDLDAQLNRLLERLDAGEITREQYEAERERLLAAARGDDAAAGPPPPPLPPSDPYAPPAAQVGGHQAGPNLAELGFWDRQFIQTHMAIIVLVAICCGCPGLIIAIIGTATCQTEEGKRKARTMLIVSLVMVVISFILNLLSVMVEGMPQ